MEKDVSGIKLLLTLLSIMWIVEVANILTGYRFSYLGIRPRDLGQWYGILLAPFLHWSIPHIIANSIPFVVLGYLVHKSRHFVFVSLFVWLVGGALVWLFGRNAVHAGASGMIMGYFGFLISHGFFTRSVRSILISLGTFLLYGGLFFTLLVFRPHISFEGHIFGFLAGLMSAWLVGKDKPTEIPRG